MIQDYQEYHLLQIADLDGSRTIAFHAATYSVGRASSNALVVHDPSVSRNHCLFIRMPVNKDKYVYRIVDGGINGMLSMNGLLINGDHYAEKILETQDFIQLGHHAVIHYMIANMSPREFETYFGDIILPFHSVQDEVLDPTDTLRREERECLGFFNLTRRNIESFARI